MAFPVIGGTQESGYNIDNSLRFNDGDSAYLSKSLGASAGGSNTNATFSFWIKRGVLENQQILFNSYVNANNYFRINLRAHDAGTAPFGIEILDIASGSDNGSRLSNQGFKDVAAWYHIFVTTDSDNGTNEDRVKVYINNERITSWASSANWGSTFKHFADNATLYVGTREGTSQFYDGYFAEFHAVDGQELAPTDFGETDDNGVWIPKNYTGSYGTNGFKLEFKQLGTAADATSIGADTSGNDNHFSQTNVTPAVDRTEDTPTNNFCTLNPLSAGSDMRANGSFKEGNCELVNGGTTGQANGQKCQGTMGFANGKWYWEVKLISNTASLGIVDSDIQTSSDINLSSKNAVTYDSETGNVNNSSGTVYTGSTYDDGDIIGIAADADNGFVYFAKNGTYQNSGDPTSGSSGTGGSSFTTGDFMLPLAADNSSGSAGNHQYNFGNAPFSISSGNSDANGYGNFEYAVPSGYYALCTKNLAEYG